MRALQASFATSARPTGNTPFSTSQVDVSDFPSAVYIVQELATNGAVRQTRFTVR